MYELTLPDGAKFSIPCPPGQISDGYHSFDELYDHRCLLFIALMNAIPEASWYSSRHDDGSMFDGWFIAGMNLPETEPITYHLPYKYWELVERTDITLLEKSPKWDGHTSDDVLKRLQKWVTLCYRT